MKRKNNNIMLKWIVNIGLSILSLIALFPIISLVISSFRPSSDLMREGISFNIDLSHLNLDNYIYIFTQAPEYGSWYGKSLVISAIILVLSLVFSSMVGYALALYAFQVPSLFFVLVLLLFIIPF